MKPSFEITSNGHEGRRRTLVHCLTVCGQQIQGDARPSARHVVVVPLVRFVPENAGHIDLLLPGGLSQGQTYRNTGLLPELPPLQCGEVLARKGCAVLELLGGLPGALLRKAVLQRDLTWPWVIPLPLFGPSNSLPRVPLADSALP